MIEVFCDTILRYLKTLPESDWVDKDDIHQETRISQEDVETCIHVLLDKSFIDNDLLGFYRISQSGRAFIAVNSFEKESATKNAEFQALQLQISDLTDKVSDYSDNKWKTKWSFIISVGTFLIALAALIVSIVKSRN